MVTTALTNPRRALSSFDLIATVVVLGMLFQIGHFAEHAFQFLVWLLGEASNICGRDTPWMSPWAEWLCRQLGWYFVPGQAPARQMMIGTEVLHLIGNAIFLTTLSALWWRTRDRMAAVALGIETFHLYEHIMLTTSAVFIGKPIGMSTLFGGSFSFEKEAMVGIRVAWHFAFNLIPLPFALVAMWRRT